MGSTNLIECLRRWAETGLVDRMVEEWLLEVASSVCRKAERQVEATWREDSFGPKDLLGSLFDKKKGGRALAGRLAKHPNAGGLLAASLTNQLQDLVRERSPQSRLFRRLTEASKDAAALASFGLTRCSGSPGGLEWVGPWEPSKPISLASKGRFDSPRILQAAAYECWSTGRPWTLGQIANALAREYAVSDARPLGRGSNDESGDVPGQAGGANRHRKSNDASVHKQEVEREAARGLKFLEIAEAVDRFRGELSEHDREIFGLDLHLLSERQIAKRLGESEAAISRAVQRIRSRFERAVSPIAESLRTKRDAFELMRDALSDGPSKT